MARPTRTSLDQGMQLGEFVIGERIGRGGFADVYLAKQSSLGRDAVIKVLRHTATARHLQHFEQEARLASQLDHPFAAHVYAFGVEDDGLMWIAMELVRGISLAEWVETKGPIPLGRFVTVFERLCEVVHTAHLAGLIHRDIKPSNVMVVTRAGRLMPKLLDFGIATVAEPAAPPPARSAAISLDDERLADDSTDPRHTADEAHASGTPAYMAPEQWHAGRHDHRVDIYALGVLAYRCLTGRPPFHGRSAHELYLAHQRQPVPALGGELPVALDVVIRTALAKGPEGRYASALELAMAFQNAASASEDSWLGRDDVHTWLVEAPPHLAACIASVAAARSLADACDATQRLLAAIAQWLGILAIAATASLRADVGEQPQLVKLHREPLTPRDWLELGAALCAPYADHDEDFPIPELVRWFADDDSERRPETLLAASAVTRGEVTAFPRDVLARVLRGLRFVHAYTLFIGDDAWTAASRIHHDAPVWISDGDRNLVFELSPLVVAAPPAPGEAHQLFAVLGGGRSGAKQVTFPEGYERESSAVWPWLEARFATTGADRGVTIADRAPYRGLATFSAEDAELFFGRERVVGLLYNRMLLHPFVALTGPSGSGKSSLVHAGLIPRLPDEWIAVTMRPGRHPIAALDAALSRSDLAEVGAFKPAEIYAWLRDARRRLVLVIDQAEELLTIASHDERGELASKLSQLVALGGERVRVIVTLRHDFLGRADELPEWRELIQQHLLLVTVPTRDELGQMIIGPAAHVGYAFDDPALVLDMVAEVADRPGGLPLLSFAASRLWDARDPAAKRMTREAYVAMGGVGGALAGYAEETFAVLSARQQAITRDLLRQLITAEGTRAPARRADLASITDGADAVVEHLIAARILVASERLDGGEDVALIHEALIDRWPRLIQWRADDAAGARHRDELRAASALWQQHALDPSYLWRGEALATYRRWAPRWSGSLTAPEAAFGQASVRAETRARRVRRTVIATALTGLTAAVLVLVMLYQRANRHRDDAEERFTELLADRGRSELLAERPLRALVYLTAAYERGRDGPGMRLALAQAARAMDREQARVHVHRAGTSLLQRASLIFSSSRGEPIRSWRLDGGKLEPVATFAHPGSEHFALGVSPSGDTVATGGLDSRVVRVWDRSGKLLGTSAESEDALNVDLVAVGSDDLIATRWSNVVALWDRNARQLGLLGTVDTRARRSKQRAISLVFSEDASRLAVGYRDGIVQLWEPRQRRLIWSLDLKEALVFAAPAGDRMLVATMSGAVVAVSPSGAIEFRVQAHATVFSLSVSPDSTKFATAGAEPTVKIWSVRDGKQVATLAHAKEIYLVRYSGDGKLLVARTNESIATLWDAERHLFLGRIDAGGELEDVTFASDSKTLVTSDTVGRIQRWDVRPDHLVSAFEGHKAQIWSAACSPDGTTVATLGADQQIRLWRADDATPIGALDASGPIGRNTLERIEYLPDGRLAAPFSIHVALWDVARRLRVGNLPTHYDARAVAIDRSGKRIAVSNSVKAEQSDPPWHVVVWDPDREQIIAHHTSTTEVTDLAFDPEGTRLVMSLRSKQLVVWDIEHDRIAWSIAADVFDVDYSPDGRFVTASATDGYVQIRHAATGEVFRSVKQPGRALAVAFAPDSRLLATAVADNRIYLWDVETGQLAGTLTGHENIINSLVLSRDGSRLVSVSRDQRALVWSLASERRSPAELAKAIAARVPFRLVGAELVANDP